MQISRRTASAQDIINMQIKIPAQKQAQYLGMSQMQNYGDIGPAISAKTHI
jgi:hypothetical protein